MPARTITPVVDLELSNPVPPEEVRVRHGAVQVLLRLHGRPLGLAPGHIDAGRLDFAGLVPAILEGHAGALAAPLVDRALAIGALPKWPEVAPLLACRPNVLTCAPRATVVVRSSGRGAPLGACLSAARALDYPSVEIIVADGAVTDAQVVAQATGDILAILDDTVVVDRGWLAAAVRVLVADPDAAAVTGLVLPRVASVAIPSGALERRWHRGAHVSVTPAPGAPFAAAFWRDAVETVASGFSRQIADLLQAGHGIVHEPSALAWHSTRMAGDPCVDAGAQVARLAVRPVDLGRAPRAISDAAGEDALRLDVTWDGRAIGQVDLAHHGGIVSAFRVQDAVTRQLAFEVLDVQLRVGAPALRAILTAELTRHLLSMRRSTAAPACPQWVEQRPAAA